MRKVRIKRAVILTAMPGSEVFVNENQYKAIKAFSEDIPEEEPKKSAKKSTKK